MELGPRHLLQPLEHDSHINEVRLAKNVSGQFSTQVDESCKNKFGLQDKQLF